MTTYTKTDNYALNLYGDTDPADLRDGYNGSMHIIDTTLEAHLSRIEGVESRETHNEEVAEALLGDNTVDAATTSKTKWDNAATDSNDSMAALTALDAETAAKAATAKTKWDKASTDAAAATDNLNALHANSVESATIIYEANAMDIRKLGCRENDDTQDCGAMINAYLAAHPNATIYVPNGVWYTKSTITISGEQSMMCDGCIRLGSDYSLTGNTMIKLHGSDATVSSAMPKNKTFKVSVDGNMQNVNGISVQGYYASTFVLSSTRALGIAVRTASRNIENYFNVRFYGGYNNERAQIGFQIASDDNDNRADVIGRNANVGVDNHSSYWFFGYIHVWGCAEGVKLYPDTSNIINNFYPDYTLTALTCDDTPSAIIRINNIQSILPQGYYLVGDNTNNKIVLIANQVYIPAGYAQMFRGSPAGILGNIQINDFNNKVIAIAAGDLQTFTTTQQFIDKYGYIASDEIIAGITVKWPAVAAASTYVYDTFKTTQAGQNLAALKYHISRTNEYLWGRSTLYATKRLLRDPAYPQTILWEILQNDMPKYYMVSKVGEAQTNMALKTLELTATTSNTPVPIG